MNDTKWVSMWGNAMSIAEHHPEGYAKDLTLLLSGLWHHFPEAALRFTARQLLRKGTCHHPPGNGGGV